MSSAASSLPSSLSIRDVLKVAVFRRIWYAQVISLFGDFLAIFAVISVVSFQIKGTASQITWVQISYMLPLAILSPLAGVFVDRWPLKQTLISSDLSRAALSLFLLASTSLWHLYAALMAISCISSFFGPAQTVTIRSHVPKEGLLSANALMQQAMLVMRIVGPAIAGLLVSSFGEKSCYILDTVSFLVSAALIYSVTIQRAEAPVAAQPSTNSRLHGVWLDLSKGFSFILHHAALFFVILSMAAAMFTLGCFGPLIAIYVRDYLHASSGMFGAISAMIGLGIIAGTTALRPMIQRTSNDKMVLFGLGGIAAAVLALGLLPYVPAAFVATFVIGLSVAAIIVPAQTLLQQETPPALMGRISSTMMSIIFTAQVLGLLLSGTLAQLTGVREVFLLSAVFLVSLILLGHYFLRPKATSTV